MATNCYKSPFMLYSGRVLDEECFYLEILTNN